MGELGAFDDFLVAELVAFHLGVLAAYAAIEAVFRADVAVFDEAAQVDAVVQVLQFHLKGTVEESLLVVAFSGQKELDFLFGQVLLM